MRDIDTLILHCADTPNGRSFSTADIDAWHVARKFQRAKYFRARQNKHLAAIGYHFAIYINGACATGRHLEEVGAHAYGHNDHSIGTCLIGRDAYTIEQWEMLRTHVWAMQKKFPGLRVIGHREVNSAKTCPGFDVQAWLAARMAPLPAHIFRPDPPTVPEAA